MVNCGVRNGLHADVNAASLRNNYNFLYCALWRDGICIYQIYFTVNKIFSLLYDTEKKFDVMQRFPTTLFSLEVVLKFICDVKCALFK